MSSTKQMARFGEANNNNGSNNSSSHSNTLAALIERRLVVGKSSTAKKRDLPTASGSRIAGGGNHVTTSATSATATTATTTAQTTKTAARSSGQVSKGISANVSGGSGSGSGGKQVTVIGHRGHNRTVVRSAPNAMDSSAPSVRYRGFQRDPKYDAKPLKAPTASATHDDIQQSEAQKPNEPSTTAPSQEQTAGSTEEKQSKKKKRTTKRKVHFDTAAENNKALSKSFDNAPAVIATAPSTQPTVESSEQQQQQQQQQQQHLSNTSIQPFQVTKSRDKSTSVSTTVSRQVQLVFERALVIHPSEIQPYCTQITSPDLENVVRELVQTLDGFHQRYMAIDPQKANLKRRFYSGFNEVTKHLRRGKLRCVIMATNIQPPSPSPESITPAATATTTAATITTATTTTATAESAVNRFESSHIVDKNALEILLMASERNVPVVFAMSRRKLGSMVPSRTRSTCSVIGIALPDGADVLYPRMLEMAASLRDQWLDEFASISNVNSRGESPVWVVASSPLLTAAHPAIVQKCVAGNRDILGQRDSVQRFTPLMAACRSGNSRALADLLLLDPPSGSSFDVSRLSSEQYNCLHLAVIAKSTVCLELLLKARIPRPLLAPLKSQKDPSGRTPVNIARDAGLNDVVDLLT